MHIVVLLKAVPVVGTERLDAAWRTQRTQLEANGADEYTLERALQLTEAHGGRCWVEERPGGGASFRLFLPDVGSTRDLGAGIADEERVLTRLEPDMDEEEEFEDAAAIAALREYGMGEGSISI